jgi:hypothetical protein
VMAYPGGRRSVQVEETAASFENRHGTVKGAGTIAVPSKIADQLEPGMIIKITALGLTEKGMFREAQLCNDSETSWLIPK